MATLTDDVRVRSDQERIELKNNYAPNASFSKRFIYYLSTEVPYCKAVAMHHFERNYALKRVSKAWQEATSFRKHFSANVNSQSAELHVNKILECNLSKT